MNVAVILSGGVGKRFGSDLPKQYHDINGRPCIQYVLDEALKAKTIDEIVIAIDNDYLSYLGDASKFHIVPNGKERVNSVKNCLDYIHDHFNADNIIILQAVNPFFTHDLIDEYINYLNDYDVVVTAEKCPGELFNIENFTKINRNNYYFVQSPEAFKFKDLYRCLDLNSSYSELVYHYDFEPKIKYYTEFKRNIKLTFKEDLEYADFLMKSMKR